MKKISTLLTATLSLQLLGLFIVPLVDAASVACPTTQIANCALKDKDNDGWLEDSAGGAPYINATTGQKCKVTCAGGVAKKGGGDCVDGIGATATVPDKDGNPVQSRDIHPEATDVPGNGVDEDCDGADAGYAKETSTTAQGVMDNIKNFLTFIVGGISGIVLIIGGIMYATAAGEEQKQKKARKAMVGAIVGLLVAVLSNVIISIVAQNVVNQ